YYLATILSLSRQLVFVERRCRILVLGLPRDAVVRHHNVHGVFGTAPRHVAGDAVLACRMASGLYPRMAAAAGHASALRSRLTALGAVGIVAARALKTPRAPGITPRLQEPIARVVDLKLVVEPASLRMVEMHDVVRQRLSRPIGERLTIVAPNRIWQP